MLLFSARQSETSQDRGRTFRLAVPLLVFGLCLALLLPACSTLQKPEPEPFVSETTPPPKQEFRWSNGRLPKSFDPALAAAPPETDIVRAVYEGLTELNAKTLEVEPAAAESWDVSEDGKTWTFHLRPDAKWSNGEPLTGEDFVRSWTRLAEMGDRAAHSVLLENFAGYPLKKPQTTPTPAGSDNLLLNPSAAQPAPEPTPADKESRKSADANTNVLSPVKPDTSDIGVTAVDEITLQVSLDAPDPDFPKLVAHPIFRPIFGDGSEFEGEKPNAEIVTNGAFSIASVDPDGISLTRSESYWNKDSIKLEHVRFVPMEDAERALEAYRSGELDAVSNAEFSPLALKLLEPYKDFRRTTHNALNLYEFNHRIYPYDDRRVREALAIAIERERLVESELEGTTQPALRFLPFGGKVSDKVSQDREKARDLLDQAGFPNGENFPTVRLVINRNDTQQRVAKTVAEMWKRNLNLKTEIIVKESKELEDARKAGDYDLMRRGVVLPTVNELAGFMAIFGGGRPPAGIYDENGMRVLDSNPLNRIPLAGSPAPGQTADAKEDSSVFIRSEEEALYQFYAIPLYFPTSYSLVKPYVTGFEINSIDAPVLKDVVIDNTWQPKGPKNES
jgi:oligopeptide transport system substrate-binding protein